MWLLIPILLYSIVFLYVRHVYSHWKRKGFPSERVGITWRFLRQAYEREFSYVHAISETYAAGREHLYGIYCFFRPILLVRDVKLARMLLEQSNGHFSDIKWDYVKGYRRFNLLEKLAPIFSNARLEAYCRYVEKVSEHMVQHLELAIGTQGIAELDMQHLLRIYVINVIGNLVYGQDANSFAQTDSIFSKYVQQADRQSGIQSFTLRRLAKKSSLTYRLRDLIKRTVEQREEAGFIRKDVLQLLVKFRNGNELAGNNVSGDTLKWHIEHSFEPEKLLSVKHLSKVAEELLRMSLDTTAATITLTFYEILREPLIMEKIVEEIKQLQPAAEHAITPAIILNLQQLESLKYMDLCIKETLRKYPPVPIIERTCRKTYTLPNSRYTIFEGKMIMVPLLAIQRDEKYFAEPLKYKPTRFMNIDINEQHNEAFMSYGIGDAQCIAQNFAKLVIKIALLKLFRNFEMTLGKCNDSSSIKDDEATATTTSTTEQLNIIYRPTPWISAKDGLKVKFKKKINK